jgi:hypothetical protein
MTSEMASMMHKSGFTPEEMTEYMNEAGLVDVEFMPLSQNVVMQIHGEDLERTMFFARGKKA